MLVTHGHFEWKVDMTKVDSIEWSVSEREHGRHSDPVPGSFYWVVLVNYESPAGIPRHFILESGILPSKVEALTRARGRARFFRSEQHREKANTDG